MKATNLQLYCWRYLCKTISTPSYTYPPDRMKCSMWHTIPFTKSLRNSRIRCVTCIITVTFSFRNFGIHVHISVASFIYHVSIFYHNGSPKRCSVLPSWWELPPSEDTAPPPAAAPRRPPGVAAARPGSCRGRSGPGPRAAGTGTGWSAPGAKTTGVWGWFGWKSRSLSMGFVYVGRKNMEQHAILHIGKKNSESRLFLGDVVAETKLMIFYSNDAWRLECSWRRGSWSVFFPDCCRFKW